MSIKDLIVKSIKSVDSEANPEVVLGKCPHCAKEVTAPKKHKIVTQIKYRTKIKYRAYPKIRREINKLGNRILMIEEEVGGSRAFDFSLFGRKYSLRVGIKRCSRLEDLLVTKSGKKPLKYRII